MALSYTKEQSTYHVEREKKEAKKRKPIPKKSAKRVDEEKVYRKERDRYLKSFQMCEVKGCPSFALDIHHKKGRIGSLLTDSNYFMGVCRSCHKVIEENPVWAKEKGYSLDRL